MLPAVAHAVNYATATKQGPGYELKLIPFYYSADLRTDKEGNPAVRDLELKRYGVIFNNCYQINDLMLSVLVPVAKLEIGKLKNDDAGLGDIQLRAGWNLPVQRASLMSALMLKLPTGGFDTRHAVNLGDGQADLATELYFFKLLQPLSFDALLRYGFRFRNSDSDVTPGNEFSAEGLVTYRLAEKVRFGPALNFLVGGDNRKRGTRTADSGLRRFSAGGELWYGRFDAAKISLAAYKDVQTRNTNEGFTVLSRIVFKF